ncbi:hypothetical protein D3C85_939740 [compost metagenome]
MRQPLLERIKLPVGNPLAAIAHTRSKQLTDLDFAVDLVPGFTCQPGELDHRQVVGAS